MPVLAPPASSRNTSRSTPEVSHEMKSGPNVVVVQVASEVTAAANVCVRKSPTPQTTRLLCDMRVAKATADGSCASVHGAAGDDDQAKRSSPKAVTVFA